MGLGLFLTGNELAFPPAARNAIVAIEIDSGKPIAGPGILPLWFQGIYGGPVLDRPCWNHPRFEHRYAGAMRHFIPDPVPFEKKMILAFTPGVDSRGVLPKATALLFWYDFNKRHRAAPDLPERAEPLPYSVYRTQPATRDARPFRVFEAESFLPLAMAHGGQVLVVEDKAHDFHPSNGAYLYYRAERPGDYLDCLVPFPPKYLLCRGNEYALGLAPWRF